MQSFLPDLNKYKNRTDIVAKVAQQIEKDLQLNDALTVPENAEDGYLTLFNQVLPIIKSIALNSHEDLRQLMYLVDISEKKVAHEFSQNTSKPEFEIYTHLIVEREFIKVLTRLYFSNKLEA